MFRKALIFVVILTAIFGLAVSSSQSVSGQFDNHITLVSVPVTGDTYNTFGELPHVSYNEHFVVFTLDSVIHVRDLQTQTTETIPIPKDDNITMNVGASSVTISGDGRFVAFATFTYATTYGDIDGFFDIYVYDRNTNQYKMISASIEDDQALYSQISVDGRYVIFEAFNQELEGCSRFFVYDLATDITHCINNLSSDMTIEAIQVEGLLTLVSIGQSTNLFVYTYDFTTGQLNELRFPNGDLISSFNPVSSPNGRFILFTRYPSQSGCNTFLEDLQENIFQCMDDTPAIFGSGVSWWWAVSSDGNYIAYMSQQNLVDEDNNYLADIYLYSRAARSNILVSKTLSGESGVEQSEGPKFSSTGSFILFISLVSDLVEEDYDLPVEPPAYPFAQDAFIYEIHPEDFPTTEPVIFIPGVAGSVLKRVSDGTQLWPTIRTQNNLQQQLSLKPGETIPISATDVIRNFLDGQITIDEFAVYEPFLKTLRLEGGYLEYVPTGEACDTTQTFATLFVFPYDFRSGASDENVARLKDLIDCVRTIHPDQKVNIVAHSMGGLLSRKYILNNPDHHVDQLITIATPWLGAPQAINVLLTGDWLPQVIAPNTTRSLAEYWTATHQLLPNQQYFSLAKDHLGLRDQPMAILNQDPQNANSYQFHSVTREEFNDVLQSRYSSPSSSVDFIGHNDALFDSPDFADWTNDQSGVTHTVIFGDTRAENTIVQFYERHDRTCNLFGCSYIFNWDTLMGRGDETVPLLSSTRKGTGYDLNGNATLYRFAQGQDEDMSHLGLIHSRRVQDCVMAILEVEGKECLADSNVIAAGAEQDQSTPIDYLRIWGVSSLEVSDGISTTGDLFDSTNQIHHVDEVKFNYLGTDSILIMLPHDLAYVVDATATDRFFVEVTYGTGENSTQFQRYIDSSVMSGTAVRIDASNDIFQMTYDRDNDGKPETLVTPTSDLAGDVISDTNAPTVTLTIEPVNRTVTITATDDASGVGRIFYSLDGTKFNKYDQLLQIGDEKTVVYAQAEDQVGNLSEVVSLIVEQKPGFLFLPLVRR